MIKDEIQVPKVLNKALHNFDSVLSKRMFWAIMAQLRKGFGVQKDLYENLWISIPTRVLNNQHFADISKATDNLQALRFVFSDPELERFNKIVAFPVVHYDKKSNGIIKVKIESSAYSYLAELTGGYFWIKTKAMMMLSSSYAQRWYELLSEKKEYGRWENVTIERIRELMGVDENEYKRNANFLQRVVYEPIQEINDKTELFITYEPMFGIKRPIQGFTFSMRGQKAKGEAEIYERIEKHYEELQQMSPKDISIKIIELQRIYSIPPKTFDEIMGNTRLIDAVLEADAVIQAGKVTIQTTKAQYMAGVIKKARG